MNSIVPMRVVEPQRPRDYNGNQLSLIRQTVAKDTTPLEFDMFVEVCKRVGLDPLRRQIYCRVYSKDDPAKRQVVFITAIDGFRAVAARNRDYRPDDQEPEIAYDPDLKSPTNPRGIVKAVVRVYKYGPDGQWHPSVGVARWDEFVPLKSDSTEGFEWVKTDEVYPPGHKKAGKPKYRKEMKGDAVEVPDGKWASMPDHMLSKCAEAQALRKGWPEDLSGVYTPEEMAHVDANESATIAIEQHEQEQRLLRIGSRDTIPIQWELGEPIEATPVGKLADKVAEFVGKIESVTQIEHWERTNQAGLREFWALHKSDALDLKKVIEARKARLAAE